MRHPDWRARLFAHVEMHLRTPFVWGRHDCCTFADGAVAAVLGAPLFEDWLGGYDGLTGAWRQLRQLGHDSLDGAISARLPIVAGHRRLRRGDLAAFASEDATMPALGVVTGQQAHCLGVEGLTALPLVRSTHGWMVG